MVVVSVSAVGLLGLAHTGIQASIVEAPLVATVFQVELNRESTEAASEPAPEIADPEPIENLPSTAHLSAPRHERPQHQVLDEIATAGRVLTEDEIRMLARAAGWPEHTLNELLEVAWCESSYNPTAMNGQAIHGLMQVHTLWFSYSGLDRSQWSNALVNLQVALAAYNYDLMQGHAPWTQWQCRPGGIRIPTEEFAPHLPDIALDDGEAGDADSDAAASGDGSERSGEPTPAASGGSANGETPSGGATPEPTPAPWDAKPSWPPVVDREDGEAETASPDAGATPPPGATAPGVVVIHPPDAPAETPAATNP